LEKKFCNQIIPFEPTLWIYIQWDNCSSTRDTGDVCVWLSTDKTKSALGRYTAHLIGKLDSEKPSKHHLLCSKTLEKVNSQSIPCFIINKGLNILYPSGVDDT
jgi:hypothetical protein